MEDCCILRFVLTVNNLVEFIRILKFLCEQLVPPSCVFLNVRDRLCISFLVGPVNIVYATFGTGSVVYLRSGLWISRHSSLDS